MNTDGIGLLNNSQFKLTDRQMMKAKFQADENNKKLGVRTSGGKGNLGKDAFLKLLVTQLKHQDPTKPMEDKEFISQMAQFSSLEQMTNLNKEVKSLFQSSQSTQAFSMLGKEIDAYDPVTKKRVSGKVTSVKFDNTDFMLMVGKTEIPMSTVHAVHHVEENKTSAEDKTIVQQINTQKQ